MRCNHDTSFQDVWLVKQVQVVDQPKVSPTSKSTIMPLSEFFKMFILWKSSLIREIQLRFSINFFNPLISVDSQNSKQLALWASRDLRFVRGRSSPNMEAEHNLRVRSMYVLRQNTILWVQPKMQDSIEHVDTYIEWNWNETTETTMNKRTFQVLKSPPVRPSLHYPHDCVPILCPLSLSFLVVVVALHVCAGNRRSLLKILYGV